MCNLSCQINSQVGGDHAYCDCECHKDTLPAVPPSRARRKLTTLALDFAVSPAVQHDPLLERCGCPMCFREHRKATKANR